MGGKTGKTKVEETNAHFYNLFGATWHKQSIPNSRHLHNQLQESSNLFVICSKELESAFYDVHKWLENVKVKQAVLWISVLIWKSNWDNSNSECRFDEDLLNLPTVFENVEATLIVCNII